MKKIYKTLLTIFLLLNVNISLAQDESFDLWLKSFKKHALKNGISEKTFDLSMSKVKFIPKVIEYDRFQPEFYEDTKTYINKRTSDKKVENGIKLYKKNKILIDEIEKKFSVEKELLLALMGIETNFGKYLGKMDILSSLATLSYDKRRSDFFTSELIIILQLIEIGLVDQKILYGSWAGAFGNFQFMPSTIKNYAIDYDNNNIIELKKIEDSFASAANYINKIGWKKNQPCFKKVELSKKIPKKFLNTSAKKIKNKTSTKKIKKYLINSDEYGIEHSNLIGVITPDKDIIPEAKNLSPAYLTYQNYDLILKWNRSLRFALAVCTLKEKISNEL
jgi:membrane-bound lytic murein transglycosylase B